MGHQHTAPLGEHGAPINHIIAQRQANKGERRDIHNHLRTGQAQKMHQRPDDIR